MKAYRFSILCLAAFAIVYPLISGSVLVLRWDGGIAEIYPIAPWALFCFIPNQETDYALRLTALDGQTLDPPQFFEDFPQFTENEKTVGVGIIDEMGRQSSHAELPEFREQQQLFENNFLKSIARRANYEIVQRRYDVLERWRTGGFDAVDVIGRFTFRADSDQAEGR